MKKILSIDDDKKTTNLYKEYFAALGFSIVVKNSGKAGLNAFKKQGGFDIVLTDIDMPGLDGNDVAKVIRRSKRRKTPVIAITGSKFADVQKDLFNEVLEKPIHLKDLKRIIDTY